MALSEADIFKGACENSFAFYVRQYLKVIEPETEFEWNWHMDVLCHYCERVYYGDYQNLDINIPPRMLKSLIISILFPCWVWTKEPSKKFLCSSRSYDLSTSFNIKRRSLIESEEHQKIWPIIIRDDINTTTKFANYSGGFMKSASALGKITGDGADFLISDDLIDAMDAMSSTKREATAAWFSNAWYNRVQSKRHSKRINVNQRTHMKDPSGNIREKHNFHRLIIPMVATETNDSTVDFVDPRKPGEFLFPNRYNQKDMEDEYKAIGVYGWSSQYQQSPKPIGGGIIKREWIRYYDVIPDKFQKRIITADLAFKGGSTSDFVCFQCWGVSEKKKYLIDIVRGKWSYLETKSMFVRFCEKNPSSAKYIEDKANGPALISDLSSQIASIHPWPPKGSSYMKADKVQRVYMVSQDFESGDVYLPKNIELVESFIDELTSFTEKGSTTGNDDMVDTSTMALIELRKTESFFVG